MKTTVSLITLSLLFLLGCTSHPAAKRYTVFPMCENVANATKLLSPYRDLRVRMANDLRAYSVPLTFHADGSVTPCRAVTYYAPLELALTRALKEISDFDPTAAATLKLEVRDYCVIERPATESAEAHVQVLVTLAYPLKDTVQTERATRDLPLNASDKALRDAFAEALLEAYSRVNAGRLTP